MKKQKYSPMMEKYLELKNDYQDAIVFYRLGDFYEMFFDDAITASKELGLALTGKNAGVKERVPMCGVPFHSVEGYVETLVNKGHKVVIVEQLSDPKASKGLVERGVVQIVTPGTLMAFHPGENENHFIGALGVYDFNYVLSYADLSTGEFYVMTLPPDTHQLEARIDTLNIAEIITDSGYEAEGRFITRYDKDKVPGAYKKLFDGLTDLKQIKTSALLLNYLMDTQLRELDHMRPVQPIVQESYVTMDGYTKKALELTENPHGERYGTLLWLLDHTKSAMGSRLMRSMMDAPLVDKDAINARLDVTELFLNNFIERDSVRHLIDEIYDLEKLSTRIAFGNVNARDLRWLCTSLRVIPKLRDQLESLQDARAAELCEGLADLSHITETIEQAIVEDPPLTLKEGGIIKDGYYAELDELRSIRRDSHAWLSEFEEKERERTGIKGLKIGYNRVFGYYIEITKSYLDQVTDEMGYTRKQSLVNAERFITPELKTMEDKILSANDRIMAMEYDLFTQIRDFIRKDVHRIQDVAAAVAKIDVASTLAEVAATRDYVRPTFNDEHRMVIKDGRHAVIEEVIGHQNYVANDITMDRDHNILMITGPNMGGKSTYMRQVTLTAIMAQMGSYVPARSADMPVFDQIFTRIGASDDLISGQSTFMVEMVEANNALRFATENSLIIFDEIGRGTATFDGMALAQAIIEYIATHNHSLTLFSTHYHELTYMSRDLGITNVHAGADLSTGTIRFLYKMREGASGQSYGINVARLAHLPEDVIQRADVILKSLEEGNVESRLEEMKDQVVVTKTSEVEEALKRIDPMTLSPLDALSTLIELKKMAGE